MRKPVVSRTMKTTVCKVLCANVSTESLTHETLTLTRHYADDSRLLGILKATYETQEKKILCVEGVEYESRIYAMDEDDFLAHAHVIER